MNSQFKAYVRACQAMPRIEYGLLQSASDLYFAAGFEDIHVPWTVPVATNNLTKPNAAVEDPFFRHGPDQSYELVGSAEQGFLYLIDQLELPSGKYQSISPCFRAESDLDQTHFPWFMKLELCTVLRQHHDLVLAELNSTVTAAQDVMARLGVPTRRVATGPSQFDLVGADLELGSYGVREFDGFSIVYGTGLALPRFSQARNILRQAGEL